MSKSSTVPAYQRRAQIAAALFPQLARIGKALASPSRLMLLELLSQCPRSVESLSEQTGMSVANTSQHLQQLRAACLVKTERQGQHVIYHLASDEVGNFYVSLRKLAASHLAELDRIKMELVRPLHVVDSTELIQELLRGDAVLLDVRPVEEFESEHLPGALGIPVEMLEKRIDELPRGQKIVAYCRGPYCTMAEEAVELLRSHGIDAFSIDLGVIEMKRKFSVSNSDEEMLDVAHEKRPLVEISTSTHPSRTHKRRRKT